MTPKGCSPENRLELSTFRLTGGRATYCATPAFVESLMVASQIRAVELQNAKSLNPDTFFGLPGSRLRAMVGALQQLTTQQCVQYESHTMQ
jgi:hypothetical protein